MRAKEEASQCEARKRRNDTGGIWLAAGSMLRLMKICWTLVVVMFLAQPERRGKAKPIS